MRANAVLLHCAHIHYGPVCDYPLGAQSFAVQPWRFIFLPASFPVPSTAKLLPLKHRVPNLPLPGFNMPSSLSSFPGTPQTSAPPSRLTFRSSRRFAFPASKHRRVRHFSSMASMAVSSVSAHLRNV
ncbi:hypothetical protein TRVL_07096 [Trypanosoma vivax]|nr:hypothetical protein TRVL_07096 [Trypanosoma vivax]